MIGYNLLKESKNLYAEIFLRKILSVFCAKNVFFLSQQFHFKGKKIHLNIQINLCKNFFYTFKELNFIITQLNFFKSKYKNKYCNIYGFNENNNN